MNQSITAVKQFMTAAKLNQQNQIMRRIIMHVIQIWKSAKRGFSMHLDSLTTMQTIYMHENATKKILIMQKLQRMHES